MSKINCDICGTVYPDNANACPICGYPRKGSDYEAEEQAAAVSVNTAAAASARVKGGRFSNKNVKKRNQAAAAGSANRGRKRQPEEEKKNNKGLVIAVVLLFIAVLLVGGYILWRFIDGRGAYDESTLPNTDTNPSTSQTDGTTEPTETEPEETGIPCIAMTISDASVELSDVGRGWKLSISLTPVDTTDTLTFVSSDEDVVYVSPDGRLTAMGPGTATITITCGQVSKVCTVYCNFEEETQPSETTEATEPEETTRPTEANTEGLKLSHSDVTLFYEGESFTIKVTDNGAAVSPAAVVWASSDESVATVGANGKVTAVAGGSATITATYNGKTLKCIVRCKIEEKPTEPQYSDSNWKISHSDVTISVGESFTLKLTNDAGETAAVTWSMSKTGVVSMSGNKVTGAGSGTVSITATIDGQTFTCIVRVK